MQPDYAATFIECQQILTELYKHVLNKDIAEAMKLAELLSVRGLELSAQLELHK